MVTIKKTGDSDRELEQLDEKLDKKRMRNLDVYSKEYTMVDA